MRTIAIIPARGGSTRIPRKNIKPFHGKPIIAYSIEAAINSKLFDTVYVSTDDDEVALIASEYGAEPIVRPDELAVNEVGTQEVISHACMALGLSNDDLVMGMYATCPLLKPIDIVRGLYVLKSSPECCYSIAVDDDFNDVGQYYWGYAWAFKGGMPLGIDGDDQTFRLYLDAIDINTPEDWERAERMYEELHGH